MPSPDCGELLSTRRLQVLAVISQLSLAARLGERQQASNPAVEPLENPRQWLMSAL